MRDTVVALVRATAETAGRQVLSAGGDQKAVARAVMVEARGNWLAPDENEAFAGAVAALWLLYPEDQTLRDETKAIGDRNKLMSALVNDVPVDFDRVDLTPMPDNALGLIDIWLETA